MIYLFICLDELDYDVVEHYFFFGLQISRAYITETFMIVDTHVANLALIHSVTRRISVYFW